MKPEDLTWHLATHDTGMLRPRPQGVSESPNPSLLLLWSWARAQISCGWRSVALSTEGTSGLRVSPEHVIWLSTQGWKVNICLTLSENSARKANDRDCSKVYKGTRAAASQRQLACIQRPRHNCRMTVPGLAFLLRNMWQRGPKRAFSTTDRTQGLILLCLGLRNSTQKISHVDWEGRE